MSDEIKISIGDIELSGEFKNTECAKKIKKVLPVKSDFNTWGNEFYFSIGLELELDQTAKEEVDVGTVGYWPDGKALAIFFGQTPASTGEKPRAASKVNIVGQVENAERLKEVKGADEIKVKLK